MQGFARWAASLIFSKQLFAAFIVAYRCLADECLEISVCHSLEEFYAPQNGQERMVLCKTFKMQPHRRPGVHQVLHHLFCYAEKQCGNLSPHRGFIRQPLQHPILPHTLAAAQLCHREFFVLLISCCQFQPPLQDQVEVTTIRSFAQQLLPRSEDKPFGQHSHMEQIAIWDPLWIAKHLLLARVLDEQRLRPARGYRLNDALSIWLAFPSS